MGGTELFKRSASVSPLKFPHFHPLELHQQSYNSATMSKLEQALKDLKEAFDKYASTDEDKSTLSKKELSVLLREELPEGVSKFFKVDQLYEELDTDMDGIMDFRETVIFLIDFGIGL
ncbi:protein S100-G-like [Solea solea]|uniref:protein S100-G-like n=1 Tax=Solea solea TaxID=90069 RepID=UPI00272DACFD|nr:protein S100-G-like [Solea solea]